MFPKLLCLKKRSTIVLAGTIILASVFFFTQQVFATPVYFGPSITSPLAASSNKGSALITFTSDSDITPLEAECSIDNFVTSVNCTTGVTTLTDIPGFTAHAQGVFTLSVRDDFNRDTYTDSEAGIIKDTVAPVLISIAPTNGTVVGLAYNFVYSISGNADFGTITLERTGGSSDSSVHVFNLIRDDITNGQHTFSVSTLEAAFGNSLVDGAVYSLIYTLMDAAGNPMTPIANTGIVADFIDPSAPARTHITSSNSISNLAKIGDTVSVTALVDLNTRVSGTIGGKAFTTAEVVGDVATLTRVLDGTETEGAGLDFTMFVTDGAGNNSETVTKTSIIDESSVQTDFTAPALPTASPIAGTYSGTQNVTLSSTGASIILFTIDGTTPTCSVGTVYSGAISVSSTKTIKAKGCDAAGNMSTLATLVYTITTPGGGSSGGSSSSLPPSLPTASPVAGSYTSTQNITLSSSGATSIRYTLDGTMPTCSLGTVYVGAIPVSSTKTIRAKGCNVSGVASTLATFLYTITVQSSSGSSATSPALPIASPVAGTYASTQNVTLSSSGATSIRYTLDGTTPTCAVGTVYTGAISVTSTKTIKARGCNASGITSALATFAYTINILSGGTTIVLPPKPATVVAAPAVIIHDPAQYQKLLSDFGLISDPVNFEMYKSAVQSDANAFGIAITAEQARVISNFITYGASVETIKLGAGERRALIRDYFETVGRADVVWDDVQRMTIGQKPVKRNLAIEQSQVSNALAHFRQMVGHAPDFKDASEDLAWNTLMYRIRFPRNLVKERQGIETYERIFIRIPRTPFDWAVVRALGYVLR